jgi:hypothetical protein
MVLALSAILTGDIRAEVLEVLSVEGIPHQRIDQRVRDGHEEIRLCRPSADGVERGRTGADPLRTGADPLDDLGAPRWYCSLISTS